MTTKVPSNAPGGHFAGAGRLDLQEGAGQIAVIGLPWEGTKVSRKFSPLQAGVLGLGVVSKKVVQPEPRGLVGDG